MLKLILNRFLAFLCYAVPIVILLIVFRDSLFRDNVNSFSLVFGSIVGAGALAMFYFLGIYKIKSLYILLLGAMLAWLLNTSIDTRVFYILPLTLGAGMFIEEVILRPVYRRIVITVKGDKHD